MEVKKYVSIYDIVNSFFTVNPVDNIDLYKEKFHTLFTLSQVLKHNYKDICGCDSISIGIYRILYNCNDYIAYINDKNTLLLIVKDNNNKKINMLRVELSVFDIKSFFCSWGLFKNLDDVKNFLNKYNNIKIYNNKNETKEIDYNILLGIYKLESDGMGSFSYFMYNPNNNVNRQISLSYTNYDGILQIFYNNGTNSHSYFQ